MSGSRGFTLLETVIALAILAMSLTVLLTAQASGLANAGRSRDLTLASLLARSKMIDIERHLFHDGFQMNTEDENGDFGDEGHPEITWRYKISEVTLDLGALTSLCKGLTEAGGKDGKGGGDQDGEGGACEAALGGIGAAVGGLTEEIGRSLRVVDLKVAWTDGRYHEKIGLRALLSRDDFATAQESEMQKAAQQATGSPLGLPAGAGAGVPGGTGAVPLPAGQVH